MVVMQHRAKRKPSGGRYKSSKTKKKAWMGSQPSLTKLAAKRSKFIRTRGGNLKFRLLSMDTANVFDPKTKKFEQLKIKTISDNPANRYFIRRNIMNKGAIIDTDKGKARITSRPGQDGVVNAVLIGK